MGEHGGGLAGGRLGEPAQRRAGEIGGAPGERDPQRVAVRGARTHMMDAISGPPSARPPGAFAHTTGTFFKVWAPKPGSVDLVLLNGDGCESVVRMNDVGEGYWTAEAPGAGPGQRYLFGIEGARFP